MQTAEDVANVVDLELTAQIPRQLNVANVVDLELTMHKYQLGKPVADS